MDDSSPHPVTILYRNRGLLALNKPAGLPVHGSRIFEDQPETLLGLAREKIGRVLLPVHRLDRPVSGLLLMAETKQLQADLGRMFEQRRVTKTYLAVVRGWPAATGLIDHPLGPVRDERKNAAPARPAVTRFTRIATAEVPVPVAPYPTARYSLLALQPETGRRHQLRRHLKHASHPLVGDTTYGRGEHNRLFRERFSCNRLLLHAWSLELPHPASGERLRLTAPLDAAYLGILDRLGWRGTWLNWCETT
jgi:tRNA pseudouridine65 synthase